MKKAKPIKQIFFFGLFAILFIACNDNFVPKHMAYPIIIFPKKEYQIFDVPNFPYTFEYPRYAKYEQDSFFFEKKTDHPYWINLQMDALNATIYITYKNLKKYKLDQLIFDSYKITNKQVLKATSIQDSMVRSDKNYQMVFYTVTGDAATTHQFFATDKKKHFIRGSLYLNTTPNEDSLKVVTDFLKADIIRLLNTLKFR